MEDYEKDFESSDFIKPKTQETRGRDRTNQTPHRTRNTIQSQGTQKRFNRGNRVNQHSRLPFQQRNTRRDNYRSLPSNYKRREAHMQKAPTRRQHYSNQFRQSSQSSRTTYADIVQDWSHEQQQDHQQEPRENPHSRRSQLNNNRERNRFLGPHTRRNHAHNSEQTTYHQHHHLYQPPLQRQHPQQNQTTHRRENQR